MEGLGEGERGGEGILWGFGEELETSEGGMVERRRGGKRCRNVDEVIRTERNREGLKGQDAFPRVGHFSKRWGRGVAGGV